MTERSEQLRDAFAALDDGDVSVFAELFRSDAQWRGIEGVGWEGRTPLWRDRREVVDLLTQKHEAGRRFAPVELIEGGDHVAVQLHDGVFKVFTFAGDEIALMQDCVGREDALARLG